MDGNRNLALGILGFAAFSAICYFGAVVIVTLLLGVLVAFLLDPFVCLLRRLHFPQTIAILAAMAVSGVILALVIALFVDRAQEFTEQLPRYRSKIQKITRDVRNRVLAIQKQSQDIGKTIMPPTQQQPKPLQIQQYSGLREFLFRDLGPFYDYLIQISFFPFLVYFLLAEKNAIRSFVSRYIRARTSLSNTFVESTSDKVLGDLTDKIRGFVFGYLLSTLILFLLAQLLFLVFRVQNSFVWAVLYTLLNVLPFVGAWLGAIVPILVAVFQFTSVQTGIIFLSICVGVHLFYANWLIPRTVGPRTELSPLMVLLSMMYWGFLWGALGIFLAVPITASLKSIWHQYRGIQQANQIMPE